MKLTYFGALNVLINCFMILSSDFDKENQATELNVFDAKLLNKVVVVASQLSSSYGQAKSTFNIMLLAYYKISCALSTKEQLLSDPKYPTLIKKLSLLPIDTLAKTSINQGVLDLIDNAIKLKCLHLWKIGMRARVANLRPMDLVRKRDFALNLYWQVLINRALTPTKPAMCVEEQEDDVYVDSRKSFFNKWRLMLRQAHYKQRLKEKTVISRLKSFLTHWRIETAGRIYRRYHLPRKVLNNYWTTWRTRLTRALIQHKSADIYDDMRLSRHALLGWCILFDRVGKLKPKAEKVHRRKLLARIFERWQSRRAGRSRKEQLFCHWRSRLHGYMQAEKIGMSFYKQKQLVRIKRSLGRGKDRISHMASLCNTLVDKKEQGRRRASMKTWRARAEFNTQKIKLVDEWRQKRDKRSTFKMWSKKSKRVTQADALYNVTLAKRCLRSMERL